MGLDMALEFDKYCVVDRSPNTVLPPPRHSKTEKTKVTRKPRYGNEELSQNKDFTDLAFNRYRSASCRTVPSKLEGNEVQRRGSVYQSSNDVRNSTKKIGGTEERKKIEFPQSNATAFSLEILDSLCSSDEDSLKTCSPTKERVFLSDCVDMSLDIEKRAKLATEDEIGECYKFRCDPSVTLPKSLSARLAVPQSPCQFESDSSGPTSPKSRFSPIRKMFDPFVKSKSQKSPLGSAEKMSRNKTLRKSLLHDFSSGIDGKKYDTSQNVMKDSFLPVVPLLPCSPAHLSGILKVENKHSVPFFEFSVKNREDVIVAKSWKVGNALNWVYTFHSTLDRRKSNVTGRGSKEISNKESAIVGQMQVSCYLCTELRNAGDFENSMVTEFVLYDIAHQRRSDLKSLTGLKEGPPMEAPPMEARDLNELPDQAKLKLQPKHDNDLSILSLRAPSDLHSELEIAAIVIQLPFEKRESLKCKRGDWRSDDDLLSFSGLELEKKSTSDCLSPGKMSVVTPLGNHGVPIDESESGGPSPLLDRWRLGGGCDCGGWDMGCPLVVFGNPNIQFNEDHKLLEKQQPVQLFIQGTKEKTPGLMLRAMEEGQYAVDFHAQLTSLQAFSICVAILHSSEASIANYQELDRDGQLLQCDSLRVFVEDEVKYKIKEHKILGKKMEETPPFFVVNPPFSPIARV